MAFYTESISFNNESAFQRFAKRFMSRCEIIGYCRAASILRVQGMVKEADNCLREADKLREELN